MKHRVHAALLAVLLCFSLLPAPAEATEEIAAHSTRGNGNPYYIMVNRKMSTVTVYTLDENGYYTVPVRAMLCSTGTPQHATPKGNCAIGRKYRWHQMLGGVYAQYLSQFRGSCLFHSVCYARPKSDTLLPGYYDALGSPASHGCVRLQTEDAKWIYENCAEGTYVTIYDSNDPGELGKPEKMVPAPGATNACRWDPTDPEPENPWWESWTTDFSLSAETVVLVPGETASLELTREPAGSTYPTAMFLSDAPSVAVADGAGRIRAVGAGVCTVTVSCGEAEKRCTVVVTELPSAVSEAEAAPEPTAEPWYASDVSYLCERGFVGNGSVFVTAPEAPLTRAETLDLFRTIFRVVNAVEDDGTPLDRTEFIELLYLYSALRVEAPIGGETPVQWAMRLELLYGHDTGELGANEPITRAQAAAILHRYCVVFNQ
ncbi:MAG: hypothetical protein E7425_00220 [Ruminococcaceae bacterium]|nr:hypothetical protein [Oscillospiraceae bacterium]